MDAKDIQNNVSNAAAGVSQSTKEYVNDLTKTVTEKVGRPNINTKGFASKPVQDQNITTTTEKAIVATFEAIGNFYDALKNSSVEATPELALGFEMLENGEDTDAVMEQFNKAHVPGAVVGMLRGTRLTKELIKEAPAPFKKALEESGKLARKISAEKAEALRRFEDAQREIRHAADMENMQKQLDQLKREFNFKMNKLNNEFVDDLGKVSKEAKVAASEFKMGATALKDAKAAVKGADLAVDAAKDVKNIKTAKDFLDTSKLVSHASLSATKVVGSTAGSVAKVAGRTLKANPFLSIVSGIVGGASAYSNYNDALDHKDALIKVQVQLDLLKESVAKDPNYIAHLRDQMDKIGIDVSKLKDEEVANKFLYEFRVVAAKYDEAKKNGDTANIEKYGSFFNETKEKYKTLVTISEKYDEIQKLTGRDTFFGSFGTSSKRELDTLASTAEQHGIMGKGAGLALRAVGWLDWGITKVVGTIGETMAKAQNREVITPETTIDEIMAYEGSAMGFLNNIPHGYFSDIENFHGLNRDDMVANRAQMEVVRKELAGALIPLGLLPKNPSEDQIDRIITEFAKNNIVISNGKISKEQEGVARYVVAEANKMTGQGEDKTMMLADTNNVVNKNTQDSLGIRV
jgi:hypothetical protein